jgi:predicted RNA-binding protein with PIN domain
MPVLIDGNNLLHRLAPAAHSRADVRRLVLDVCRHRTTRITVVFDGPPPSGSPSDELLGSVTIVYSGAEEADAVIVRKLPAGRRARNWLVVTDDRELAARVRQRGAEVRRVRDWLDRRQQPPRRRTRAEPKLSSREVAEWQEYFARGDGERSE